MSIRIKANNEAGFAYILELILIALVIAVIAVVGWNVYKKKLASLPTKNAAGQTVSYDQAVSRQLTNGNCSEAGSVPIIAPMPVSQIGSIQPYGLMVGGHVTPVDHQYYIGPDGMNSVRDTYDVLAPADGWVVSLQHRGDKYNTPPHTVNVPSSDEYRIVFSHSCSFLTYVDLVTSLSNQFKAQIPDYDPRSGRGFKPFKVTKGEVIGHIGGQTLDFAVWDLAQKPLNFIVPQAYNVEPWKIYTAPPSNYFDPSIKAQVTAKYLRTAEPIDGKIDFDQDGKLVGTWFKQGTKGYGGPSGHGSTPGYWAGHLVFAPNYLDPTMWVVSVGNFPGHLTTNRDQGQNNPPGANAQQFGIKGNGPDPVTISPHSGLIKYELVDQLLTLPNGDMFNGSFARGIIARNEDSLEGLMLVQLLGERSLKVEIFPGKTAAQVNGFDTNALLYNRGDAS